MTSPDSRAELIAEGRRRLDAFESATPGSQEEMDAADSWNVWQLVNGEKLLDALDEVAEQRDLWRKRCEKVESALGRVRRLVQDHLIGDDVAVNALGRSFLAALEGDR